MNRIEKAAETVAESRIAGDPLGILPEAIRPRDEAEAYRVQAAVHRQLAASRFGRRIGYKIGCTTPVMQTYLGIPNPCAAGLFEGTQHPDGAVVRAGAYRRIGIECEIAVRLGRELAGDPTEAEVAAAVEAYFPAIEIVDDRYVDWRTTDTPTLIADDFFAAGAVLGPPVARAYAPDLAAAVGRTLINGIEAGRGVGADVLGHPHHALAWLARSLGARGEALRAGEIVLTGSLVETRWLVAGDTAEIAISGLGGARLSVSG